MRFLSLVQDECRLVFSPNGTKQLGLCICQGNNTSSFSSAVCLCRSQIALPTVLQACADCETSLCLGLLASSVMVLVNTLLPTLCSAWGMLLWEARAAVTKTVYSFFSWTILGLKVLKCSLSSRMQLELLT